VFVTFLTYYSKYFANILKSPWKEAEDGRIVLDDVEQEAFHVFVHWLYHQCLPENKKELDHLFGDLAIIPNEEDTLMVKVMVLADRFLVPILRRTISREIINEDSPTKLPNPAEVSYATDNLAADDRVIEYYEGMFIANWGRMGPTKMGWDRGN
jgi:hypothetical protein